MRGERKEKQSLTSIAKLNALLDRCVFIIKRYLYLKKEQEVHSCGLTVMLMSATIQLQCILCSRMMALS